MPKVYNKHHGDAPADAVNVMRPHPLGNPFKIGRDGARDEVCDKYEAWLAECLDVGAFTLEPLRGRDLVCCCAPLRCHADTILRLANA